MTEKAIDYKYPLAYLVNQIYVTRPADDYGHELTNNIAYIEARNVLALPPDEPPTHENLFWWSRKETHDLCLLISYNCPQADCYVALTGGCLYHLGRRKDLDIQFYRDRRADKINLPKLWEILKVLGFVFDSKFDLNTEYPHWLYKATYKGKSVDIMFPESDDPYNEDDRSS